MPYPLKPLSSESDFQDAPHKVIHGERSGRSAFSHKGAAKCYILSSQGEKYCLSPVYGFDSVYNREADLNEKGHNIIDRFRSGDIVLMPKPFLGKKGEIKIKAGIHRIQRFSSGGSIVLVHPAKSDYSSGPITRLTTLYQKTGLHKAKEFELSYNSHPPTWVQSS